MDRFGGVLSAASAACSAAVIFGVVVVTWPDEPIRVVDGDTVRRGSAVYRIMGYDAPEIRGARCDTERRLAARAHLRLADLVKSERVVLAVDGRRDRYGRRLARLMVDGEDVATIAVREGWGRIWRGRREGWC